MPSGNLLVDKIIAAQKHRAAGLKRIGMTEKKSVRVESKKQEVLDASRSLRVAGKEQSKNPQLNKLMKK